MDALSYDIVRALEKLISLNSYTDFQDITADINDTPDGFGVFVTTAGNLIGTTMKGNKFTATAVPVGMFPVRLRQVTFSGTTAVCKACFK
jgi:hypothetical protein